jgi:peptide/nickel transport system permease protein
LGDLRSAYLLEPGGRFLLGTDTQGRDVLSRVLYGAWLSLSVGLISQSVAVTPGVAPVAAAVRP